MNPVKSFAVVVLIAILLGCVGQERKNTKPDTEPAIEYNIKITTITEKGGRVDWSHALNVIAFDKRGDDGFYDVYIMNPDGSGEYCLTDTPLLPDHHIGNPAWHPTGAWLVFQVVNTDLIPSSLDTEKVNQYTNPGAGWLNNLWVMDRNGEFFYQLTDVYEKGSVLHAHFSHDGKKLMWAERIGGDTIGVAGVWTLKVADFVTEPQPHLVNIGSFTPGEQQIVCESHGFSYDDTKILFCGNLEKGQPPRGWDIYDLDLETQELTRLTDTFYDWDEHAHYSPDGKKIVWMSSTGYDIGNTLMADFWIMNSDGLNKHQLTFFNIPGHSHYRGFPIVAGDSSWSPDGNRIIAYIKTESAGFGSEGSIIMIEFVEGLDHFSLL